MESTDTFMPFGLQPGSDLSEAEIFYTFRSPKTGAGLQELTISGSGEVRLFRTANSTDQVGETRIGHVDPEVFVRLLDVIEGKSFLRLEDHYPPEDGQFAPRIVRLTLPGVVTKEVIMQRAGVESFEQVAVAIELTAALALPEAINHRFFKNL